MCLLYKLIPAAKPVPSPVVYAGTLVCTLMCTEHVLEYCKQGEGVKICNKKFFVLVD